MKLKNIFLKGRMNKDNDERLVAQDEYIDALNLQVVKSEGSDAGAIENLLGNKQLTLSDYGPNPECIGGIADDSESKLYWFVVSDTGSFLMEYDFKNRVQSTVLKDTREESILNLNRDNLITGINIIIDTDTGNRLLLWVDDLNPPRCINIERAKTYGPNNFGQDEISLIKRPPLFPPTITPTEDDSTDENNLRDKFLAFSYRYKYLDGEYSALSPFTTFTFLPKGFDFDYATGSNESMVNSFKEVEIKLKTGSKLVTDVEVFFKESGSNNVYFVESFNKDKEVWPDDEEKSISFSNNKVTKVLAEDELFRLYDNVPLKAKAQDVISNRVMFGNYVENYNLIDKDGNKVNIDLTLKKVSKPITGVAESIKSNRDYEAGIVYLDGYGRMTTPLTSQGNTQHVPVVDCVNKNTFKLDIAHKAPEFAKYYRIFIKQDKENYDTIVVTKFHRDGVYAWLKMGPTDINKFKEGDYLVVKSDTHGALDQYIEVRVVEVKDQPRNFLVEPKPDQEEEDLPTEQEAGMYFKIKPVGFRIDDKDLTKYNFYSFNSTYKDSIYYEANYIDAPVYYGNLGKDDLTVSGAYTASDKDIRYIVAIDSVDGAVDTFKWSDDDGVTFTKKVPITGSAQSLSNGVSITFGSTTGHSGSDEWIIPAKGKTANGFGVHDGTGRTFATIKSVDGDVIEGGATIEISVEEDDGDGNRVSFKKTYTSSRKYANIEEWAYGDGVDEDLEDTFGVYFYFRRGYVDLSSGNRGKFRQDLSGEVCLIIRSTYRHESGLENMWGANDPQVEMVSEMTIIQSSVNILFETKETPVNSDIFYELGRTYPIVNGLHMGSAVGDKNQTSTTPATIELPFFNCFAWGNAFESYKIKDSITGNSMLIDSRPLGAITNYRQNHRVASLTYSGVYEQSMNYNALNEFNLSMANYKDIDDSYGSIQKIYSRDSNLLVIQENKASQVFVNKSVLYNADGSTNLQKSTEVLGECIPYSGEFGISLNPESFVAYGTFIGWADARRGKIIKLGGNGMFPISNWGMTSWFRNYFKENPGVRVLGGYDPYVDKMILSTGDPIVSPYMTAECGQEVVKFNQDEPFTYYLQVKEGTTDITLEGEAYGTITIGTTDHPVNGTFSINQVVSDELVTITVTPTQGSYNITNLCTVPQTVTSPDYEPDPVPPAEYPAETGTYYVYLASECPSTIFIDGAESLDPNPEPVIQISSPEKLDMSLTGRAIKAGGTAYTFLDTNDYAELDYKPGIYIPEGNKVISYPSCFEATRE